MTHVLHRSLRRAYPVVRTGRECLLTDGDGRDYIDAASSAAVSCLGHEHPEIVDAMRRQLDQFEYAHTSFFSSDAAEALADDLVRHAPGKMELSLFVSSGSEAVEAALKLARQYHVEHGEPQRRLFIARRQSYHGATLGALAVTGRASSRSLFDPLLMEVPRVSACYEYRGRVRGETAEDYGERLAREIEELILLRGPDNVAAFIAETVVGATLGAVPPVPGYFQRVRRICDRYGVLLILDEVMCGMGRTGTLYACEQENVSGDLVAIAKGLGGGYAPIGALLVHERLAAVLRNGSGEFRHGQTYMGHPLACSAALAVQQVIRRDRLLDNVRLQGKRLGERLRERLASHPIVGDIRGRGLFWGVEFVADRTSKEPFPAALKLNAKIKEEAMAKGVLVIPMGGTANERAGDHILVAPPYIIDAPTIDEIAARIGDAVDVVRATLPVAIGDAS